MEDVVSLAFAKTQFLQFSFFFAPLSAEKENADDVGNVTIDVVNDFVKTVDDELNELSNQKRCMDLQHTFRPIFVQYFKTNLYHRYKAVTFRRVLAEKGFELKTLEDIWNEKKKVFSHRHLRCYRYIEFG